MPEPELQAAALRYAAGDLSVPEAAAFEDRLASDQNARDALSEAVRLSAAAIGQPAPKPGAAFRELLHERLSWTRARKFVWAGTGAAVVAVCTLVGLALADRTELPVPDTVPVVHAAAEPEPPAAPNEPEPPPGEAPALVAGEPPDAAHGESEPGGSVAEIWAALSSHEQVEKARDDEARWRQKVHGLAHPPHVSSASKFDSP